jgi:hypothetical protein
VGVQSLVHGGAGLVCRGMVHASGEAGVPVDPARYIVDAVVLGGRSQGDVARSHGVSKSWVAKLVWRYQAGGYEAIVARPSTPPGRPSYTALHVRTRRGGPHLPSRGSGGCAEGVGRP